MTTSGIETAQPDRWITERATVLSVDTEAGALWVAAEKASACASCKAKSGCGTSVLARLGADQVAVRALLSEGSRELSFAQGDEVDLAIDRNAFVKVALVMYLVPLLGLIAGVLLSLGLFPNQSDAVVAFTAVLGLLLGGWAASFILKSWRNDERLQPIVLRRCLPLDHTVVQLP
ncbi:MAG TPA: SoxR reducing system RseC family protein [Marinagarivorans sp.]